MRSAGSTISHDGSPPCNRDVMTYLDFSLTGGVVKGRRLLDFFAAHVDDRRIEDLPIPYGAVATDLENGSELWLRRGSLLAAVRASISVPALLKPVDVDGRWCIDGGMVNPLPVSLCPLSLFCLSLTSLHDAGRHHGRPWRGIQLSPSMARPRLSPV